MEKEKDYIMQTLLRSHEFVCEKKIQLFDTVALMAVMTP